MKVSVEVDKGLADRFEALATMLNCTLAEYLEKIFELHVESGEKTLRQRFEDEVNGIGDKITIIDRGPTAINVIKEVRLLTGLGLKEAKDFVDKSKTSDKPVLLLKDITGATMAQAKQRLEVAGATVEDASTPFEVLAKRLSLGM